jgi:hypothetical protein
MIVLEVYVTRIAVCKVKSHSPILIDLDCPGAGAITL